MVYSEIETARSTLNCSIEMDDIIEQVSLSGDSENTQDVEMQGETALEQEPKKRSIMDSFRQQTLRGWMPMLTVGSVVAIFFVVGILFIPAGVGLLLVSEGVQDITIPYTNCTSVNHNDNQTCADIIKNDPNALCECEVNFTLDKPFRTKVYMYYALTNYFQNHRRYAQSLDESQLWGELDSDPKSNCKLFGTNNGKKVFPCGAVANSMFSDEINLYYRSPEGEIKPVSLIRKGIAWESDKKYKFRNPQSYSSEAPMWKDFTKPEAWKKNLWELDPEDPENKGVQNEDFIVWMRTQSFPDFRKLYRIVNNSEYNGFEYGLPSGNYSLKIVYSYEVTSFQGTKSVILSTTSVFGGAATFLGYLYVVTGAVSMLLGVFFLIMHVIRARRY